MGFKIILKSKIQILVVATSLVTAVFSRLKADYLIVSVLV